MYQDYQIVQKCLKEIEGKLNWGSSSNWHNDVFSELSEVIHSKTGVLLSVTTLKRVWGKVNYSSAPSISTLNALSQFIDYKNWRDFKNNNQRKPFFNTNKIVTKNFRIIFTSSVIMTFLFITIYSMRVGNSVDNIDYSKIKFTSKPLTNSIPNSVVFDFDIQTIESNDILIQQFWDPTKTIKIDRNQKQATGIYYYPGYFRAKLVVNQKIRKENDLFIKSNNWLGTVDYEPIPKYLTTEKIVNEKLSLPKEIFEEVITNEKPVNTTFHFVDDLGDLSGDNFQLKASIKNTYTEKWGVCQRTTIIIVGTKSAILLPLSIKGCVSDLGVMLSDNFLSGSKNDLSALGADLSVFRKIKIQNTSKEVSLFIDDKKVYTNSYTNSLGKVTGIRFKFLGAGEVKDISLQDLEGKEYLSLQ